MSPEPLSRPPESGGGLPAVEFHEWTDPAYRIQDDDLISSRRYPRPRYRFDAPHGEYAVLYANDTKVATFNENYAEKRRRIPAADSERHLVRICQPESLRVLEADALIRCPSANFDTTTATLVLAERTN